MGVVFSWMNNSGVGIGSICSATASKAGTTLTLTANQTVLGGYGAYAIVTVASDNSQTTNGASTQISNVTDSAGNSYSRAYEYTNGRGAAQGGATVAVWIARVDNTITSGSTTWTITNSNSAYARVGHAFAVQALGTTIEVADSAGAYGTGGPPGNITLTGLPAGNYFFLLAGAFETSTSFTPTAPSEYWAPTGSNSSVHSAGGGSASNMGLHAFQGVSTAISSRQRRGWEGGDFTVTTSGLGYPTVDTCLTLGAFRSPNTGKVMRTQQRLIVKERTLLLRR